MQLLLKSLPDTTTTSTHPNPTHNIHGRPLRLDFPRLEGDEPESWIFQTEQFFTLNPIAEDQKVTMASIHLKGDAISWYRWLHQSLGDLTWRQFSTLLCKQFGSQKNIDPMSSLSKLTQQGTIHEYITSFEALLNLITGIQDPHQVSLFLSGLRADIQAGVRLHTPTSLSHAFDLAFRQEDAILATTGYTASKPSPRQYFRPSNPQVLTRAAKNNLTLPTGVKRLSWAEQKERRDKGLCFNYDELYKPGHRCDKPQLLLMDASSCDLDTNNISIDTTLNEPEPAMAASLYAISGSTSSTTMRAQALIKNKKISVLLDSGSTHNFIHPHIARDCGLMVTNIPTVHVTIADGGSLPSNGTCLGVVMSLQGYNFTAKFSLLAIKGCDVVLGTQWLRTLGCISTVHVTIADGGSLPSNGTCLGVVMSLQGYSFTANFSLLAIKGCDVVLGTQWLRTLGCISWDFEQLVMQFIHLGHIHTVIGNGSPLVTLIDPPVMNRAIQQGHEGILFSLQVHASATPPCNEGFDLQPN